MNYLFYDDETANSSTQFICQLAYVCTDEHDNEIGRENQLIDPECGFTGWQISNLNICESDVLGCPTMKEYCGSSTFIDRLGECVFVAHNAKASDLHHIMKSLERYGIDMPAVRVIDTLEMAKALSGIKSLKLKDLCSHYSISLDQHDALSDAEACRRLFWLMAREVGIPEPVIWVPGCGTSGGGSHRPKRAQIPGSLGVVDKTDYPIESVLAEFDNRGLLLDLDVDGIPDGKMLFTGCSDGMGKAAIKELLTSNGFKLASKVAKSLRLLAIGDGAGPSKIQEAWTIGIPVVALTDLIRHIDQG